MLTQAELKHQMNYDQDTGIFIWINSKSSAIKKYKIAGTIDVYGYVAIRINGKVYKAHRLAWLYVYGEFPSKMLDHIDRIKTNNSICNLRLATSSQNSRNVTSNKKNTSGYRGVVWHKRDKRWQAACTVYGKQIHIGNFNTAEEAHLAYEEFKKNAYGDNFVIS